MKRIGTFRFVQFALASAVAICCMTGTASAQAVSYKFSLPYEAHWGLATLPAGDYWLTVEGIGRDARIHISRGNEAVAFVAVQNFDMKASKRCLLTVVRSSTGNFVRDVTVPEIGEVFHFQVKTHGPSTEEELAHVRSTNGTK
jgi:hypothetical protein